MTKIIRIVTNTSFRTTVTVGGVAYSLEVVFNMFEDSYYFNLYEARTNKKILAGITLSTGTDLLSQFPNLFKLFVVPTKPELYESNPNSKTILDYQIWVEGA